MENNIHLSTTIWNDDTKKLLAQTCFYANIYSIEKLGGNLKIKNIVKNFGVKNILNFMCLYLMKVIKISKIENVITDREQLEFIIRTWIVNHSDKDIREYAMIINNGITGAYGPTYNKVSIDSLGIWTKGYLEQTRPKLLENIQRIAQQNTTTHTLQLTAPSSTPVPCPADIQKATTQLVKKYKVDLTPKKSFADQRKEKLRKYLGLREYTPEYPVKKLYGSMEDYCTENGLDPVDFISKFEDTVLSQFNFEGDEKPEEFLKRRKEEFLNKVGVIFTALNCQFTTEV